VGEMARKRRTLKISRHLTSVMVVLYSKGYSCTDIARRVGILPGSVWQRLKAVGVTMRAQGHRRVKRRIDSIGYVCIGREREHRIVAAQMLGRSLEPGESVHHINGVKTDNRSENLRVFKSSREHCRFHSPDRSTWSDGDLGILLVLRHKGYSSNRIAQEMGVSRDRVQNKLQRLHRDGLIQRRKPGRKSRQLEAK